MIQRTSTSVLTAGGMALMNKIMLSGNVTGFASGADKYSGSCYFNGKMYLAPSSATQFAEVDLKTGIITYFGSGTGYQGIVAHPNGYLYAIPNTATYFKKINPVAKTAVDVGVTATGYNGAALAPNGKIYAAPYTATQIGLFDPYTDTFTKFGSATGCFGINLAPNGYLYTVPNNASVIYKINYSTNTVSSFGALGSLANKYADGVIGENNRMYLAPLAESQFAYIDTSTDTLVKFGASLSGTYRHAGLAKGFGMILAVPYNASQIAKIDESTLSISLIGAVNSSWSKFVGGCIDELGRLACVPNGSSYMQIHPTGYVPPSDAFVIPSNLADLPTSNYNKYCNKF